MIKKTKFFIIALSVLALTGCASSYYLDGKKYEFQTPTRNENGKYAQTDSYSELEDLDKELVALNVQKVASKENYELNELDDRYKQIFLRIISLD